MLVVAISLAVYKQTNCEAIVKFLIVACVQIAG